MADLIGRAAIGAVFGELLNLVIDTIQQVLEFKQLLTEFERTLKTIEPSFVDIDKLSNRPVGDRTILRGLLDDGKKLVVKCLRIHRWNVIVIKRHTKKLVDLDNDICKFFNIEASMATLAGINALLDRNKPFDPCGVPGLPKFVIGLDQHLAESKKLLLKDDTEVLVISAPGGFGKTTLANMLCHDDDIKGVFGDNIIYVTVSKETSLKSIGRSVLTHYGINNYEFRSEDDAKNQIQNLIKQRGSSKMLLVLDDVWSESVIQDLKFEIPGYKIMVTSRYTFPEFSPTYKLKFLNDKDAKDLFCHHAFASGKILVNNSLDDLINKMVKVCNGLPLALIVVGRSLCGQPLVIWKSTWNKWSKGQSILESHEKLLDCLQTSIDALDELHKNCFLDLGLFPEDDQIAGSALMDMWVELYDLDDEGMDASVNLNHLSLRNLINLIPVRKYVADIEGHCSEFRVMQHDVLRELAIHLNRQEPEAKRRRLFTEIHGNDFPKWWNQPVNARILSISTDGEFSFTWKDDLNAPNVEVLILNLRSENYTLPQFIEKMRKLKVLIVTGYGVYPTQLENLQVLESLSQLNRIRFEHVSVSSSIQVIFRLKTLKKLTFCMCKIGDALRSGTTEYHYMLDNLKDLEIDLCYDLKILPEELCRSVQLEKLIIIKCQELDYLPTNLGNLSNLVYLRLHCCTKLNELPASIGNLHKLSSLDVSDCSRLTALPKQVGKLRSLIVIDISGCEGLAELPKSLADLKQLEDVICDEGRLHLWKNIESEPGKVTIHFFEEDRSETFNKICY